MSRQNHKLLIISLKIFKHALSLLARYYSSDEGFVKCSDLSHKIFALNKGIRLTSIRFKQS